MSNLKACITYTTWCSNTHAILFIPTLFIPTKIESRNEFLHTFLHVVRFSRRRNGRTKFVNDGDVRGIALNAFGRYFDNELRPPLSCDAARRVATDMRRFGCSFAQWFPDSWHIVSRGEKLPMKYWRGLCEHKTLHPIASHTRSRVTGTYTTFHVVYVQVCVRVQPNVYPWILHVLPILSVPIRATLY